jgi:CheY-like chemotaxis protein
MVSLLIVDDSDDIRRMLRAVVADLADPIYECRDGGEACAAFATHRPDWVLMDVSMASMDGVTATRQIMHRFPTARIVIVTQYDDVRFRLAAQASGARGYVLKDNVFEVRRFLGGDPPDAL